MYGHLKKLNGKLVHNQKMFVLIKQHVYAGVQFNAVRKKQTVYFACLNYMQWPGYFQLQFLLKEVSTLL